MKKALFIITLLGFFFLNNSCKKSWLKKVTYEGHVYDTIGGQPVKGVWIYLAACSGKLQDQQCNYYIVGQSQTDAEGHFYIHDDAAMSDIYCVSTDPSHFLVFGVSAATLKEDDYTVLHLR